MFLYMGLPAVLFGYSLWRVQPLSFKSTSISLLSASHRAPPPRLKPTDILDILSFVPAYLSFQVVFFEQCVVIWNQTFTIDTPLQHAWHLATIFRTGKDNSALEAPLRAITQRCCRTHRRKNRHVHASVRTPAHNLYSGVLVLQLLGVNPVSSTMHAVWMM